MQKSFIRKTIGILLSLVILLSVFGGLTFTAGAASSGTCGDNLTWTLDNDGLLTISGTGAMPDYDSSSPSPFFSSTAIKTVVIGSGVTSIGNRAFWHCSNMTSADIPDSVTWIGEYAFESCRGLTSVDLPDSMRTFGSFAFEGCTGLKSVELPSGLMDIPNYSFWGCSGLQTMIIPDNVMSIGIEAFHGCSSLTAMVLPSGVNDIAGNAFYNCINLTTLTLPSGVTRIGRSAFYGCNSLTDVYYAGIAAQWNNIDIQTGNEKLTGANRHYSSILFGSYPQTRVTDDTLIAALDAADKVWASYDYYTGNNAVDGLMESGDWMQFADFFCGGTKYRAVKFTAYRPLDTFLMSNEDNTYQADNGYTPNVVYYFRYEPLIWRVLDPSAGYIMCESLIDSQAYQNTVYEDSSRYYQAIGSSVYANDYAASSIRKWLNLDFWETAFTAAQKEMIKTTALDNCADEATTYDYAGTNDKIFLLSYADANNGDYGFSSDADRIAQGTDYAKCQGLYSAEGDSFWLLRSPSIDSSSSCVVYRNGFVGERKVFITCYGVRPACCLTTITTDTTVSETLYSCARAGHVPEAAVAENNVAPTCGAAGSYDSVVYCANCGAEVSRETVTVSATGAHTYGDPVWNWAKCRGKATATFTCAGCGGETQTVTDNAPAFENGQFTATVEFQNTPYTDTVSLGTGDLVEFGSYPQSKVTDETLKDALNSLTLNWTSYKYYFNKAQDDFMQYADVTYNGNRYRAVTFSHCRTRNTTDASTDADYTWQDDNGYDTDTVYWFRYEPIVWRILDADAGLMMTESIVDSQPFNNGFYQSGRDYYGDASHTHYASDWAYSSLRAWMNGDFLNTAFDSGDQNHIKNTSLVTPSSRNPDYDAGPTTDKVFLLSRDDAMNTAYGFISGTDGNESANRTAFGTDYAKCQGLWVDSTAGAYYSGASNWILRSPVYDYDTSHVSYGGFVNTDNYTNHACRGIRAALNINNLQSAISQSAVRIHHDCGDLVPEVPATCADDGTIAHYVCSLCGGYLDADRNPVDDLTIPATGDHTTGLVGVKEATATEDGYTGDLVCTACGQTVSTGEVIPATGEEPATSDGTLCVYCGERHGDGTIDRLILLIHGYLAFFRAFVALFS